MTTDTSTATVNLRTDDHRRDNAGMTYVYAVLSRRAGGISVGINLNPNNACNWRCVYCQVPDLKRGGPPAIDLAQLTAELDSLLDRLADQTIIDVAFSGNGEPTMAAEFPDAVARVGAVLAGRKFSAPPALRLITNGSQLGKPATRQGISLLGKLGGEVWFKVDAAGGDAMRRINGVALQPETVLKRLVICGGLCSTWLQTCLFAREGVPPAEQTLADYLALLVKARDSVRGVHLYGLARESCQPEAIHLSRLPACWLEAFALRVEAATGLPVRVSP